MFGDLRPDIPELSPENLEAIEGGQGPSRPDRTGTDEQEEINALALRTSGPGHGVWAGISLRAAQAGLEKVGESFMAIGATDRGGDMRRNLIDLGAGLKPSARLVRA